MKPRENFNLKEANVVRVYYLLQAFIIDWLVNYVCKSDTSGSRHKVPFAVTRHKFYRVFLLNLNNEITCLLFLF